MSLIKHLKNILGRRSKEKLSLKISIMVFLMLSLSFVLLISVNHYQALYSEISDFSDEISILKLSSSFPSNISNPSLNTDIDSNLQKKL